MTRPVHVGGFHAESHRFARERAAARQTATPRMQVRAQAGEAAELFIYDQLDSWGDGWGISATMVAGAMRELESAGHTNVVVRFNSPGGEVSEGAAIYNILNSSALNVTAQIDGYAASAAGFAAMGADRVVMGPMGMFMIHEAWGMVMGRASDMESEAAALRKINDLQASIFAARTGIEVDEIKSMLDAETWMTPAEAVEKGFADAVMPAKTKAPVEPNSEAQARLFATYKRPPMGEPSGHRTGASDPPRPTRKARSAHSLAAALGR